MNAAPREEAARLVIGVIKDLLNNATIDAGRSGSMVRLAAGDLIADGEMLIENAAIAAPLAALFDLIRLAGATVDEFDLVRRHAVAVVATYNAALSVQNSVIRFALVQCARILAATTMTSRPQVDGYLDKMNAAFDQAETVAGNSLEQAAYRSIIALHAAVTFDLTTRARPLPQMVAYDFARPTPALWIAQRLYADAARCGELVDENKPVHPAFMQMPIRALSQ
jgi:prophage DNA circulation protein